MPKQPKSVSYPKPAKSPVKGANDEGGKFRDYNPMKLKGTDHEQFAPTDAEPIRQHVQLAGGC